MNHFDHLQEQIDALRVELAESRAEVARLRAAVERPSLVSRLFGREDSSAAPAPEAAPAEAPPAPEAAGE